jgi:hypothetical protein
MKTLTVFTLIGLFILQLSANDLLIISWENLIPAAVEFDDPYEELSRKQLSDLSLMVRIRTLEKKNPNRVSDESRQQADEIEKSLRSDGIDIEGLLAQRKKVAELRRSKAESVNPDLSDKSIRMPGYLLPLDFSGKMVTEFLLVPWVGACIHTPPPPKNQIVYVKYEKGFEVHSRFTAVWITGVMSTQATTNNLYLTDGTSDINSGYMVQAELIESYEEEPLSAIKNTQIK